jgi:hypothetical protein
MPPRVHPDIHLFENDLFATKLQITLSALTNSIIIPNDDRLFHLVLMSVCRHYNAVVRLLGTRESSDRFNV